MSEHGHSLFLLSVSSRVYELRYTLAPYIRRGADVARLILHALWVLSSHCYILYTSSYHVKVECGVIILRGFSSPVNIHKPLCK